ncbi:NADH-ubiquinone oxidoreductase-F iron-sulfur binding region domain-containing protein [Arthrobacter sp. USHLN218]|uniref:NADH-ubiquinone oxidoreductase-F iron-sulfur binding region domain-containing protein n=1 Tax=Arthrobacter sp. USHLN218 TaxID=3081232 RepID=UPI003018C574
MTAPANVAAGVRPPVGVNRLFAAGALAGLSSHTATYGPLPIGIAATELADLVRDAGLTGRGGAGFAAWRKLAATAEARGPALAAGPVVIANGAEGEPLSFKDATLLHNAPHLVIDGLLLLARSLRASRAYLYAVPAHLAPVEQALAQRPDARSIRVAAAPETFISGEASAVVNAIQTGTALPLDKVRRLSEDGLKHRPTLVHNVETLAHIALIARFGADWFRSVGTADDPGTRLVSVSGDVPAEQVMEVAGGAALGGILAAAGADPDGVAAVLAGGYHGRWVRPEELRLAAAASGADTVRPGAGVLHVLGAHRCGLAETARIVDYLAGQSARQCGPCMFGLPAVSRVLDRLAEGDRSPDLLPELRRLGYAVAGRGSCHHPDGTVQLVESALTAFADDVELHLGGYCNRNAATA